MTFLELDIGDYFIQSGTSDDYYRMYWKNSEYDARFIDNKLNEMDCGLIPFHSLEIVYKVIV
jgi:hypothetical protein